jgi:hypothetical protein
MLRSENGGTLPLGLVGGREAKKDGAARNIGLFFLGRLKRRRACWSDSFWDAAGKSSASCLAFEMTNDTGWRFRNISLLRLAFFLF